MNMTLLSNSFSRATRVFRRAWAGGRGTGRETSGSARYRKLAIEGLEGRAMMAAGDFDTSFDGDGRWTARVADDQTSVRAVAPRTDGKLWVCGPAYSATGSASIFLVR